MKDRAHTGAHNLGVVRIDAAGAEQTAEITEQGQGTQNGAEVAGVLNFMQINGALTGFRDRRDTLRHRHHGDDALRRLGVSDLRHLSIADDMSPERALPVLVGRGDIQLAALQLRVMQGRLLQLQQQMLALHQEMTELGAVFFLLKFLDVVEFHQCGAQLPGWLVSDSSDLATASATLMPSTPADRIPPA